MGGEFLLGRLENPQPHPFRVALPSLYSLCLRQNQSPGDAGLMNVA
jgi:hypothetical protein